MTDPLFSSGDLRTSLDSLKRELAHEVEYWDADDLLRASEADTVEYLIDKYQVECAELRRDEASLLPVSEERQQVRSPSYRNVEQVSTKLELAVPFDGDAATLKMRASQYNLNPPYGSTRGGELILTWMGHGPADPTVVRQAFETQIDKVEQHLAWAQVDIDQHNREVQASVPNMVSQRRAKLLADRQLESGLGFPMRKRPDAQTYAVPVNRRHVQPAKRRPKPAGSGRFEPEPQMADADYEAALRVLRNARNALERSPSMVSKLKEEQIRDLLLVSLNAQFEGKAGGELFNGAGKTDILIRVDDANIFIAECKIWKSARTISEGLDQLLSYLVWRDTKAALLLFVRRRNFTQIVTKSVAQIEAYPNFKRSADSKSKIDTSRRDFVLHANGDTDREIQLAFMPFALSEAADS